MKPDPIVCLTPTGNVWLLVEEARSQDTTLWFNLETSELRELDSSLRRLTLWGWVVLT